MFYNRRGIQKQIFSERKEQERLDNLSLNEWMTPGLKRTIDNAAAEARHDMSLSWEDMCNPRISTWTRNLKKAKEDMSRVMFGNTQWDSTGKYDRTASEAMHMAWKPKDYPGAWIPQSDVLLAYQRGQIKVLWASSFLAGHCFKTAFSKVNEVKGKVTTDEEGKLGIDGQFNLQLNYLNSSIGSHSTTKFFTFGDKYLLMQTGFQRFVLMLVRDTRGRIANKRADFIRLQSEFEKKRNAEIDKQYGSVNGKIQPRQNNLGKQ